MKGFVRTPEPTVDSMVDRLFREHPPHRGARLLDPGCGYGAFIDGVLRWCNRNDAPLPEIVGIDLDAEKINVARKRLHEHPRIKLIQADFLTIDLPSFDYIIGNPPYVSIYGFSPEERIKYRRLFRTARGRLDLYLLFWERGLNLLQPNGRLVLITPEKFTYVETARPLRELLSSFQVEELFFASEDTFPGLITYPTITTLVNKPPSIPTIVQTRDGKRKAIRVRSGGESWQPVIHGSSTDIKGSCTLQELAIRVSCGVATGADGVFVHATKSLPPELKRLSYPTLAGRDLCLGKPLPEPSRRMLVPYDMNGGLLQEDDLEALGTYLNRSGIRERLEARTCARRKPWYAFHETPRLKEILRPKLLSKDLTPEPYFWVDREGSIVPRHSVYYVVPRNTELLDPLAGFLNSNTARAWLRSHCHRAANSYLRVQSAVLKKMPIPDDLAGLLPSQPTLQ